MKSPFCYNKFPNGSIVGFLLILTLSFSGFFMGNSFANSSISGGVWHDINGSGKNEGEAFINGFTVQLFNNHDELINSSVTGGAGVYSFDNLETGIYYIKFLILEPNVITNYSMDCSITNSNGIGTTNNIEIGSDTSIININAGYYILPIFGGDCWRDKNKDGIQDNNEFGFSNVEVWLYRAIDTAVIDYTVSDLNGKYHFGPNPDITPGAYFIKFGIPHTFHIAPPDKGNEDNDSDADSTSGKALNLLIKSGDEVKNIDCGFFITPPISCDGESARECLETQVFCDLEQMNEYCVIMNPTWIQVPIPGCGSGYAFHNPSWYSFVAQSEKISLIIHATNCVSGGGNIGIQWGVYDRCDLQGPVILQCPCVFPGDIDVDLKGLKPGQTYYFFIDGCSGTMCSFWLEFINGVGVPEVLGPKNINCENQSQNFDNIKVGEQVTLVLEDVYNATHYYWKIDGDLIETDEPRLITQFYRSGVYDICVSGSNGCKEGDNYCIQLNVVGLPCPESTIFKNISRESCIGACDGMISIDSISNAVDPLTFLWSNGSKEHIINNLCAGEYTVIIKDSIGCYTLDTIAVLPGTEIIINVDTIVNIQENTYGAIILSVNEGKYSYEWTGPNQFTSNNLLLLNLKESGCYKLMITDKDSGCTKDTTICIEDLTNNNDHIKSDDITIYPNPANEQLNIDFQNFSEFESDIKITDLSGKNIFISFISKNERFVNVKTGHLPVGLYVLDIRSKNKIIHRKFEIVK